MGWIDGWMDGVRYKGFERRAVIDGVSKRTGGRGCSVPIHQRALATDWVVWLRGRGVSVCLKQSLCVFLFSSSFLMSEHTFILKTFGWHERSGKQLACKLAQKLVPHWMAVERMCQKPQRSPALFPLFYFFRFFSFLFCFVFYFLFFDERKP